MVHGGRVEGPYSLAHSLTRSLTHSLTLPPMHSRLNRSYNFIEDCACSVWPMAALQCAAESSTSCNPFWELRGVMYVQRSGEGKGKSV